VGHEKDALDVQVVEAREVAVASDPRAAILPLLQAAVNQGIDVASLEKLTSLYERLADRRAAEEFGEALSRFQAECPVIRKDGLAKFATKAGSRVEYSYSRFETIVATIRPHLHRNGLSFSFDGALDGKAVTATCTLRHLSGHSQTATFSAPVDTRNGMLSDAQQAAQTRSYCKRQALLEVLGIATGDEVDDDAVTGGDGGLISDEQALTLNDMIADSGADRAAFLRYMGVDSLADLPAARYTDAVRKLEAKRRSAGR